MATTRVWNVLDELSARSRELQSRVTSIYNQSATKGGLGFVPAVDVSIRGDDLVFRLELPGIDIDRDVEVSAEEDVLRITGERRVEPEGEAGYHFHEMRYGRFERSFPLPDGTDPESISAEYCDGILEVRVADAAKKLEESRRPKRVPVKSVRR